MAHYLVMASPREAHLPELRERLSRNEFTSLRPFGKALSHALRRARRLPNGKAIWEEEDYCQPPLAEERAAVLDHYFDQLSVESVVKGSGWALIDGLPAMFPELVGR